MEHGTKHKKTLESDRDELLITVLYRGLSLSTIKIIAIQY